MGNAFADFNKEESEFVLQISNNLLAYGLLYGEDLKDYIHKASTIEGAIVNLRDYTAIEVAILERVDKKICKKQPDKPIDLEPKPKKPRKPHPNLGKPGQRKARPVLQIDPVTEEVIGEPYKSCYAAGKAVGVPTCTISYAANGRQKTSGGYKWKYAESTT